MPVPPDASPGSSPSIRRYRRADAVMVHGLMRDLASAEGNLDSFTATQELLDSGLSAGPSGMLCWVADTGTTVVGAALCVPSYLGVTCRPVLRLLNLIVAPGHRGGRLGVGLVGGVAAHALARGFDTIEFQVRSENGAAQGFYRELGADEREGWRFWRLGGPALARAATA